MRMKDLPRAWENGPQRPAEDEKTQPTAEPHTLSILGDIISLYVELERKLPKEEATAFYDAICEIERILREAHAQGICPHIENQEATAAEYTTETQQKPRRTPYIKYNK